MHFKSGLIAGWCALATLPAVAATPAKAPPSPPAITSSTAAIVPNRIINALNEMGTALRALTSFELKSDITTEDVLDTGQKLESSSAVTYDVRRPDRLFVEITTPHKHRQFFYDGKSLTVYGPQTGYYAATAAPPTIAEMLKEASEKFGIELPTSELFQWGTSSFPASRIKRGLYAGKDVIDGRTCDHYGLRQESVDWQLWISVDDKLPCKLVIANTTDPAQPELTAVYHWTLNSSFADDRFTFTPPADAKRIVLNQAGPAGAMGSK